MSRRKNKKTRKPQEQKPNVFKRAACATGRALKTGVVKTKDGVVVGACATGRGFKTAAFATKDFVLGLHKQANALIDRVKAGEKLAEECDNFAAMLREAADRADLLETAKELRARAKVLESIAKEM